METDNASPFVRGIQNRLDTIFGEDKKKPVQAEVADPLKETTAEPDISGLYKDDGTKESKIGDTKGPDKTPFIHGIEKRLDAIFGEYDKQPAQTEVADPLKAITIDTGIPDLLKDGGKKAFKIDEGENVTEEATADHEKDRSVKILGDKSMPEHTKKSDIHDLSEHKSLKEGVSETTLSDEDDKAQRFEQLFGELVTSTSIMYSPLKDLKSTVLSIEWEVTEQIMEKFDQEVNKLSDVFAQDKIILGFLKILRFLGRYIRVKGVDAHYVSVKLLMSIYDNLEKVLLTKEISDAQKHELLSGDAKKYREWVETVDLAVKKEDELDRKETSYEETKEAIFKKDEVYVSEEPVRAAEEAAIPAGGAEMTPHEAFAFALDEIKKVISAEFSALRAELKLWRQGK
jgi:hypothetical protein